MARRSRDGRSLRDFGVRLTLWERALPQSPSVTAPSRREPWDVRNHRGMGFARSLCNTKAKLAIKRKENIYEKRHKISDVNICVIFCFFLDVCFLIYIIYSALDSELFK